VTGVLPVVALCAAIAVIGGIWYAVEGWPEVNRWVGQRWANTIGPDNDLPTLALEIGADAYRALERQRATAIERGMWNPGETDWQPVQIQSGQRTVRARVRLGGGPADHGPESKWTLAVELKEQATLLDMDAFVLRSPASSGYLNGWLYAESVRRAGLHAPRRTFADLSVNGADWGVYAIVERMSARSLADGRQAEGVIVRFNRSPFSAADGHLLLAEIEASDRDDPGSGANAWDLVRGVQEGRLSPEQAFDPVQLGRYLAHADLWGAAGRLGTAEARFYYDPVSARLEPIAEGMPSLQAQQAFTPGPTAAHSLDIAEAYVEEALRLSQGGYLDALREGTVQFERYQAALAEEVFPAYLEPPWPALAERQAQLQEMLHPAQAIQAYWVGVQDESVTELHLANLQPFPVELVRLQVGDRQVGVRPEWVAEKDWAALYEQAQPAVILKGIQATVPEYVRLRIPSSALAFPLHGLQVTTRVVGTRDETTIEAQPDAYATWLESWRPTQPTLDEVLSQHPYLSSGEQTGYLALAPGTWHVRGDLILPEGIGLWASQPVTLAFETGAMLLTSAPLRLHGSDRGMVRLLPQEDGWAGVVVYGTGATAPSSLDRVDIRGTSGRTRDGEQLPAGVTFYRSPLTMRRSSVWNATAAAALYVREAAFAVTDTEVGQALFDGLRSELAQGQMDGCAIHDVLGHGIVLSQSRLEVRDTALLRIRGEGVSSGAGSQVRARGIRSEDTGVAFAGKDSSRIHIQDARIRQAWRAALATHLEDQAYGRSSILASQILFEDDSRHAWVEEGNQIHIDDVPVLTTGTRPTGPTRQELAPTARVVHYRFGPALRLVAYDLPQDHIEAGTSLPFTLYWQASTKLGTDYTVFVHVLNLTGEIAAQWDAMPRQDTFPTTDWPVGEMVDDPHPVPLPADMPAGTYRIALGVYDRRTADRLAAVGPNGEPVPDNVVLLERAIEVE
jgi:hypothetical protein